MDDEYIQEMHELANKAKLLHFKERAATLESVLMVEVLDQRKTALALRMKPEELAVYIGITPAMYWMRLRAARVFRRFPTSLEIYQQGETDISHVAMLYGKITAANEEKIFTNMRGQTKRFMESFLSRLDFDGSIKEDEGITEITIRFKDSERNVFERAREILAHGGHVPTLTETVVAAVEILVERLDPMKKAERSAARAEKKRAKDRDHSAEVEPEIREDNPYDTDYVSPYADDFPSEYFSHFGLKSAVEQACEIPKKYSRNPKSRQRRAIPAQVRHEVWLRDEGRCQFEICEGKICGETKMLEMDHIEMVCFGGEDTVENLRLRCRHHNRFHAKALLGERFMSRWCS